MTKTYIGAKIVQAWPECAERSTPTGTVNEEGYGVKYADGYISWSPKAVFEEAYREIPEEDANGILLATREEIDRLANGGLIHDTISRDDEARRRRDLRENAMFAAIKSFAGDSMPLTDLLDRASVIADWIEPGSDAIRAAEQRGYDAARPLDPDKIMIGGDA